MKFSTVLLTFSIAALSTAIPSAESLPWAKANPAAGAAALAYAEAYAEAEAIGHADPEGYAMAAASSDDCASIACHASCGYMIIAGEACSVNSDGDDFDAPYVPGCLCGSDGTDFLSYYPACMECGWTLWKYYGGYLSAALAECHAENSIYSTEPTGTSRCSTTLTDSYTVDTGINYSTYL